ncbi:MAG: FUSC family protein, partial [Nocardioidaceae bacterium]
MLGAPPRDQRPRPDGTRPLGHLRLPRQPRHGHTTSRQPMYLPVIDPTLPGPDPSRIEQAAWRSRGRTRHLDPMLARLALSRGALFRSLKCGLAAALAWAAATTFEIHGPLLAPLVAMLTVEVTVWQSVSSSMQRVVGLLVGVMAALGLAGTVGLHAWTIGVVVTGTLLMGYALRLRDRAGEAAATALIVMGVAGGSAGVAAQDRVFASLMGAAAGVLVSLIVIPTTEVGPAGRALNRFSDG